MLFQYLFLALYKPIQQSCEKVRQTETNTQNAIWHCFGTGTCRVLHPDYEAKGQDACVRKVTKAWGPKGRSGREVCARAPNSPIVLQRENKALYGNGNHNRARCMFGNGIQKKKEGRACVGQNRGEIQSCIRRSKENETAPSRKKR